MYGIFTYMYHKNQLNVVKYTIHGSYGLVMDDLPKWKGCPLNPALPPRLHADAPEFNPNQPSWAPRAADKVGFFCCFLLFGDGMEPMFFFLFFLLVLFS